MMTKYTTLFQKYLKIIVFLALVAGLFIGFGRLFQASSTLSDTSKSEVTQLRSEFFNAIQEHDLSKARTAFEKLKTHLPQNDQFITEVAPSYMADLYLKYAHSLQYDEKSRELMLAQARHLSPDHPLLKDFPPAQARATPVEIIEQAQPEITVVDEEPLTELVVNHPAPATQVEAPDQPKVLSLSEQFPSADEVEEPKDGPPRIPFIDPPPLSDKRDPLLDISPDEVLSVKETPKTKDPCALSFYSKDNPLAACIDPVGTNRYGPALFVVGNSHNQPALAFTQAVVGSQDYEMYCKQTGQCEDQKPQPLIDLKDVQDTVSDYNAYCQMSGTCAKLEAEVAKQSLPLNKAQVQKYATWLSQETGYHYYQPGEKDRALIEDYFKACASAQICPQGLLQSVELLLKQNDLVLVREIKL